MKEIKIGVACHKPSKLPNNSLFVPIHVGAALKKDKMNMAHDDDGENISAKNPNYCELTAQYWLWKNQEADYYGLCHYRRFLCFADVDDKEVKRNERKQIVAYALDDYNIKKYGLDNEEEMRKIIEANDAVVGELEDIPRLYTPRGTKKTAMEHWRAHDRALIMNEDLDKMLEILSEKYPELGKDAYEYLNTKKFLGFNCFVLKKELFHEMCEIEFSVLEELEKHVDLSHYCQQLTRIYGFMGEIICSAYIYHLEKMNHKVKHVPLVYFEYTDEEKKILPIEKAIPVVFVHEDAASFKFGVILQSFLDHMNVETKYDIIAFLCNASNALKNQFKDMCKEYTNVSLRFLDIDHYTSIMLDRTKKSMGITPFVPWVLSAYDSALMFGQNLFFNDAVDELWNVKLDEKSTIASPYHVLMQARCNDIYENTEEKYLSKQVKDVYKYSYTDVMKVDLQKYRSTDPNLIWLCKKNENTADRNETEILNIIFEDFIQNVDQKWAVWSLDDVYQKYQLPYAPNDVFLNLQKAAKEPSIYVYLEDDPWLVTTTTTNMLFWSIAKRTPVYVECIDYMMTFTSNFKSKKDVLNRLFPKEGKMRSILSRMFPKTSKRHQFVKDVMGKFGMR